jgi:hypothetical protein
MVTDMETTLENTVRNYLSVKSSIEAAQETLKSLEESIKSEMVETNQSKVEVDGKIVSLVVAERRSFNADALKDLVSSAVFKQVTEPAVKTSLFDSAVTLGKIKPEVVEQVTNKTPYSQLRVK